MISLLNGLFQYTVSFEDDINDYGVLKNIINKLAKFPMHNKDNIKIKCLYLRGDRFFKKLPDNKYVKLSENEIKQVRIIAPFIEPVDELIPFKIEKNNFIVYFLTENFSSREVVNYFKKLVQFSKKIFSKKINNKIELHIPYGKSMQIKKWTIADFLPDLTPDEYNILYNNYQLHKKISDKFRLPKTPAEIEHHLIKKLKISCKSVEEKYKLLFMYNFLKVRRIKNISDMLVFTDISEIESKLSMYGDDTSDWFEKILLKITN